jgi:hypothetical protein
MHKLHCLRNIRRCAFCQRTVPVRELDEHVQAALSTTGGRLAAVRAGDAALLSSALLHGAALDAVCDEVEGDPLLHDAARCGRVEILELLLAAGASVNALNAHGDSALHVACAGGPSGSTAVSGSTAAAEVDGSGSSGEVSSGGSGQPAAPPHPRSRA